MFPESSVDWLVIQEQREDRLREAERYRLARQALPHRRPIWLAVLLAIQLPRSPTTIIHAR